jgi:hypothetical protein
MLYMSIQCVIRGRAAWVNSPRTDSVCDTDGVHLSPDGYRDLAYAISEVAAGCDIESYGKSEDGTASCSSETSKRKQPDSVVTFRVFDETV